jgi:tRNA pseudouridine65 synthase
MARLGCMLRRATYAGLELTVLHRDASCIVVNKPSGMIVHRGMANDAMDVMRALRNQIGARVQPVHRLDRGTSGALLFALTPEAARTLSKAFEEGRVEKHYWALTRGRPSDGEIDHPVKKGEDGPRVPAQTRVRCLGMSGRYALVEAIPLTGRFHQVRRHLKHVSCPIIGDTNYGKGEHNRYFREHYGLHRLALHAIAIRFEHPETGVLTTVQAPVEGQLRSCLEALGLPGEFHSQ